MDLMKMKLTLIAALFLSSCNAFAKEKQPNIVVIMVDDAGWNDFGFHGTNEIPTPNIDALAYNGIILNKFYTQQTCTPSRFALLTGKYPIRNGFHGIPIDAGEDRRLPLNVTILPESLKTLGYKTHLVGKWHLGSAVKDTTPNGRGFDTFFGYRNGWIGYFDHSIATPPAACNFTDLPPELSNLGGTCYSGLDFFDNYRPALEYKGQYATDIFTDKAIEVIKKNKKNPFFLFVSHLAPHSGKNGGDMEVPNEEENDAKFSYISDFKRKRFAGTMKSLDNSVGKIVKTLADEKILKNTIILFLSDNGAQTVGLYNNRGSSWPLRGLKFTPLEGGVRGTAIMYSPLFKEKKGDIYDNLMHISDLYPTFYEAAGGKKCDLGTIDGVSHWNSIKNNGPCPRTELLVNIEELSKYSAFVGYNGQFKLINGTYNNGLYDQYYGDSGRGPNNPEYNISAVLKSQTNVAIKSTEFPGRALTASSTLLLRDKLDISKQCDDETRKATNNVVCHGFCLYDLFKDPCETTDIANKFPEIVKTLKDKLTAYWHHLVPQPKKFVDPKADPKYCNGTWFLWKEVPPQCPLKK